jgi:hypothetical protein
MQLTKPPSLMWGQPPSAVRSAKPCLPPDLASVPTPSTFGPFHFAPKRRKMLDKAPATPHHDASSKPGDHERLSLNSEDEH